MSSIEVRPVTTAKEQKKFLAFPWTIYRNDPLWVPPVLADLEARLDPKRGAFFRRGGEAACYIAWQAGQPVGTICVGEDKVVNQQRGRKECIFGFFECIDNDRVAGAVFDQAAVWAKERGLDSLYGPFRLDYEDAAGLHIEGRDRPPVILCGHHPVYYQGLVERCGFEKTRGDGLAFQVRLDQPNPMMERINRAVERIRRRRQFTVRTANLDDWENEVDRVYFVISRALAHLSDHIPWQEQAFKETLASFRRIVDPELILLAEAEGRVVGWFPGIPNINEALIHANGLRRPWDMLKLAWHLRHKPQCIAVKSLLVLPEYWDTGVSILLFAEMYQRVKERGFTWVDLSVTNEENPDTPLLAERAGAAIYKRYRVYRKQVD